MNDLEKVIVILERYLSRVNARILLQRALRERNLHLDTFVLSDLPRVRGALKNGVDLFVRDSYREQAMQEVMALCGASATELAPSSVLIKSESDISAARSEARRVCEEFGTKSFTMHKITTIVSELARNIISYTKGGSVEIEHATDPKRRIIVRAVDTGPGIPNLKQIMDGNYRSKTGLGRGLLGTKLLADGFDISTGPSGTKIVVEIFV